MHRWVEWLLSIALVILVATILVALVIGFSRWVGPTRVKSNGSTSKSFEDSPSDNLEFDLGVPKEASTLWRRRRHMINNDPRMYVGGAGGEWYQITINPQLKTIEYINYTTNRAATLPLTQPRKTNTHNGSNSSSGGSTNTNANATTSANASDPSRGRFGGGGLYVIQDPDSHLLTAYEYPGVACLVAIARTNPAKEALLSKDRAAPAKEELRAAPAKKEALQAAPAKEELQAAPAKEALNLAELLTIKDVRNLIEDKMLNGYDVLFGMPLSAGISTGGVSSLVSPAVPSSVLSSDATYTYFCTDKSAGVVDVGCFNNRLISAYSRDENIKNFGGDEVFYYCEKAESLTICRGGTETTIMFPTLFTPELPFPVRTRYQAIIVDNSSGREKVITPVLDIHPMTNSIRLGTLFDGPIQPLPCGSVADAGCHGLFIGKQQNENNMHTTIILQFAHRWCLIAIEQSSPENNNRTLRLHGAAIQK